MTMGLVGQKIGMTRVFDENGTASAVTVIEVKPNLISQIKTEESDGYNAVQVSVGEKKASRVTKPEAGHFAKANVPAGVVTKEFRVSAEEIANYSVGSAIELSVFEAGQKVDVRARSIGKGYAGTIKRHNFSHQRMTHGNSLSHRAPGGIGQNQPQVAFSQVKKCLGKWGTKCAAYKTWKLPALIANATSF